MTTGAAQLLRLLSSGIRPVDTGLSAGAQLGANSAPGLSFSDLLKQAASGELSSALPVSIAPDANIQLDDAQLARLSLAADKLEAAGIRTALITIDGRRLLLDVPARQITSPAAKEDSGIIANIDGVMDCGDTRSTESGAASALGAAQQSSSSAGTAHLGPPSAGLTDSQSLLRLLATLTAA